MGYGPNRDSVSNGEVLLYADSVSVVAAAPARPALDVSAATLSPSDPQSQSDRMPDETVCHTGAQALDVSLAVHLAIPPRTEGDLENMAGVGTRRITIGDG